MSTRLHAEEIRIWEDSDYPSIFFGVSAGERYAMLSLATEPEDQDIRHGMHLTYLEIDDQAHGDYGAVTAIEVSEPGVRIEFRPEVLRLPPEAAPLVIDTGASGLSEAARHRLDALAASCQPARK